MKTPEVDRAIYWGVTERKLRIYLTTSYQDLINAIEEKNMRVAINALKDEDFLKFKKEAEENYILTKYAFPEEFKEGMFTEYTKNIENLQTTYETMNEFKESLIKIREILRQFEDNDKDN